MNWDAKKDKELDQFLAKHNPAAPAAPTNELAALKSRLRESPLGPRFTWRLWFPTAGAVAALFFIWVVMPRTIGPLEDDLSLDSSETAQLIDEEPGSEWALLLSSVE